MIKKLAILLSLIAFQSNAQPYLPDFQHLSKPHGNYEQLSHFVLELDGEKIQNSMTQNRSDLSRLGGLILSFGQARTINGSEGVLSGTIPLNNLNEFISSLRLSGVIVSQTTQLSSLNLEEEYLKSRLDNATSLKDRAEAILNERTRPRDEREPKTLDVLSKSEKDITEITNDIQNLRLRRNYAFVHITYRTPFEISQNMEVNQFQQIKMGIYVVGGTTGLIALLLLIGLIMNRRRV